MFEFDAANYFDRRAYNDLNAVEGGISKREQLKAASEQKIAELASASWVNQLGLDADSALGTAVNAYASFASGTNRLIGQIGAIPSNVSAIADEASTTESERQAYARYQSGVATPEDM